ncbi:MAG: hypothetical protein ACRDHM_07545 [Actinomycetota bacterium]
MSDEKPGGGYGSGRNWLKYLLIYLVVGGVAYAIIWYAFLKDGGYGG